MHPLEIQPTTRHNPPPPPPTLIFINYKLRILSHLKFTQEYLIRNKRIQFAKHIPRNTATPRTR